MKSLARVIVFVCVPACLLALAGCSGKDKDKSNPSGSSIDPTDLQVLDLALVQYCVENGKGAAKIEDLKPHLRLATDPEALMARVRSGEIVVPWNVNFEELKQIPPGIQQFVVIYEKDAPTRGGYVVMGIENPKKVTAEEFKKLKLAHDQKK
jgi:hypothetical protein